MSVFVICNGNSSETDIFQIRFMRAITEREKEIIYIERQDDLEKIIEYKST